jgi:hypothetical protein
LFEESNNSADDSKEVKIGDGNEPVIREGSVQSQNSSKSGEEPIELMV